MPATPDTRSSVPVVVPATLSLPFSAIRPPRPLAAAVVAGVVGAAVLTVLRPKSTHPALLLAADTITATVVAAHPLESLFVGRFYRRRGFTPATTRKAQLTSLTMGIFGTYTALKAARRTPRPFLSTE